MKIERDFETVSFVQPAAQNAKELNLPSQKTKNIRTYESLQLMDFLDFLDGLFK